MPDNIGSFLTELTEATSLGNDDLLYAVKYENGTPVSRKARKSTVLADAVKDVKVNGRTAVNENKEAELYISYIKNEVSGDICSFDDAEAFPVDALKVGIEPVQSGSGEPSPINIRPILGWDVCNVAVAGKNLFDESILLECSGWTVSNGVYSGDSAQVNVKYGNGVPNLAFKPNTQYVFSFTYGQDGSAGIGLAIAIKYTDDTTTQKYCTLDSIGFVSVASTAGKSIKRLELSYGANRTIHLSNMQLEEGSTVTVYEPYGHTYTIDLGGTRYGGKLDVASGVLTVDMKTVDLSTLSWSTTSLDRQIAILTDAKPAPNNNTKAKIFCDRYPTDTANALISKPTEVLIAINDNKGVLCRTSDGNTPTGQLVYELATPQTIQLTPTQVFTLLGLNNVWCDTGEIKKLVYIQDKSDTLNELLDRADEADADIKNLQDNLLNKSIMSMNFDKIDLSYLASIGTVQYNKNLRWFNSSYTPVIQDGDDIVVDVPVQAIKDLGIQVLTWTRGMSTQSFIWYTTNVGGYNNSSVTQILVSNISDYATRLCIALNKNNPYILVQADMKNVTRSTDIFHWIRNNDIPDGEISLQKINGALNVEITVGIFDKMVFVGDSFTGGAIVKPDSSWSTVGDRTWGQLICKRNGIEAGVFGVGGATTRSYLTSGLPLVLADTAGDFYMFALGLNDNSSLGSSYIGTVSDIKADYTQNPDTFYGNYARIIEQVMAHAPKARFCMVKMQTHSGSWSDFNTAIQTIAEHYEIPWIDPYDDVFFTSSVYRTMVGGHPTLLGYNGMSLAYERLLSQCFMDNQVYFRYAGINIS